VRLLIDEMYPPVIAERLRGAGHDAVSVLEVPDLAGQGDAEVCEIAVSNRRAVVTENAADFLEIVKRRSAVGEVAPSLIVTTNRAFPRHSRSFIGRVVRALSTFCEEHRDDDTQAGAVHWLRPIT